MIIPKSLILGPKYNEVVNFLMHYADKKGTLTIDILGLPHTYGGGGVHAAIPKFSIEETTTLKIIDVDFSSFYPFILLNYLPWFSRRMTKKEYNEVLVKRIKAKWTGDKATAQSLKCSISTISGLARIENPELGFNMAAIGQLFLTDLLEKLEAVPGIKVVNSNTDGIILAYLTESENTLIEVVEDFKERIKIPLEYQVIHKLYEKDVNSYVAELGETYVYTKGLKHNIEEDTRAVKVKVLLPTYYDRNLTGYPVILPVYFVSLT